MIWKITTKNFSVISIIKVSSVKFQVFITLEAKKPSLLLVSSKDCIWKFCLHWCCVSPRSPRANHLIFCSFFKVGFALLIETSQGEFHCLENLLSLPFVSTVVSKTAPAKFKIFKFTLLACVVLIIVHLPFSDMLWNLLNVKNKNGLTPNSPGPDQNVEVHFFYLSQNMELCAQNLEHLLWVEIIYFSSIRVQKDSENLSID